MQMENLVSVQNTPIHNRPLETDYVRNRQWFITDQFITDYMFITE